MRQINTNQRGLSLVEIMVALTIGLVVSGAVGTIFIQSKNSYTQNDEINYLQDNGRYALNVLASDLEVAGFFGGMAAPSTITFQTDSGQTDYFLIDGSNLECGSGTNWTYDAGTAISYSTEPSSTYVEAHYPCVAGYQSGTDFLSIKRVRGNPVTGSLASNTVYLFTDRSDGAFHNNTVTLPSSMTAWEYYVHFYYIKDNTLKKMYLAYDSNTHKYAMQETDLAEGIERFHVVFGIDSATDTDSIPDYYTSSPSATELASAVTARVYVLARGSKEMSGYTNSKIYQLGDVTVNYATNSDGYYRRVFSTAVALRNVAMVSKFSN
jgi:type IV pilus assembly protein PilW